MAATLGPLNAQETTARPARIQFDLGVANTFHYHAPVELILCFEGCTAEEQDARLAPRLEAGFYLPVFNRSELKVGVGYNEVRFRELTAEPVLLEPYESDYRFKFIGLALGYRHNFFGNHTVSPFIENNLLLDYTIQENQHRYSSRDILNTVNFAYQFDLGLLARLSETTALNVNAFFKTGLKKYAKRSDYLPYGYGVEMGLSKKL